MDDAPAHADAASARDRAGAVPSRLPRRRRSASATPPIVWRGSRRRRAARRAARAADAPRGSRRAAARLAAIETAATPGADALREHAASLSRCGAPALVRAAARAHGAAADRRPPGACCRRRAASWARAAWSGRSTACTGWRCAAASARCAPLAARPESHAEACRVARDRRARASPPTPPSCRAWSPGAGGRQRPRPRLVRQRHGDHGCRFAEIAAVEPPKAESDVRGARPAADAVVDAAAGDRPQLGRGRAQGAAAACASATSRPTRCVSPACCSIRRCRPSWRATTSSLPADAAR